MTCPHQSYFVQSSPVLALLPSTGIPLPQFRKEPALLTLLIPTRPPRRHISIRRLALLRAQRGEQARGRTRTSTRAAAFIERGGGRGVGAGVGAGS